MTVHKKRGSLGVLVGILGALWITWGIRGGGQPGSIAQAQGDNWTTPAAEKQGIRLLETRNPSGPPAYPAEAGDLLFFTNSGVSYGAQNTKNSIVVINAKTKKPIAVSDLDPEWTEKWVSHGIAVSPDAKYVYLPGIAGSPGKNPSSILVLDARTLKIHQIISSGGPPHHIKEYEDWTGKPRILVEDFNWTNFRGLTGMGFYVLDPSDNNKVVAGMTPGDIRGNLYAGFTAPDGRYLYYSVPPPTIQELLPYVNGWLAKIDMQTWKVVQSIPMQHYPLWTVFTQDGKWAWVTNSEDGKVLKIQRATAPGQKDKVVAEVPTGPGPYGMRMSIDDKDLWVADKGETLPGQRGNTLTIIDAEKNEVKRTLKTDCITNDHILISPDGQEMWATCNQSHEIVVLDSKTYEIKTRIPMPNTGDTHGGIFVSYTRGPGGIVAEAVSDQNGLHGSALDAARKGTR